LIGGGGVGGAEVLVPGVPTPACALPVDEVALVSVV
jgi:hypothetical protein